MDRSVEDVVRTYADPLVRYAYTVVRCSDGAEDVAAEALAVFCLKNKQFPDEEHLRAYLYKITRNKAVDYLRCHRNDVPLEDVENVLGSGDPQHGAMEKQRDVVLYRCLQKLPTQYAQALQLNYLEDLPIEAVCRVMGLTKKQVYNLLSRAKASLRTLLQQEGITHEDI